MESIYGNARPKLEKVRDSILKDIGYVRDEMAAELGMDPVEHLLGRIKSEESMREKCRRKGLPENADSALNKIFDAVGVRVVCAFIDDIYTIKNRLLTLPNITSVEEKDYIRNVKPNGYRSYHMIVRYRLEEPEDVFCAYAEIQFRTISMDTWAALEHHLKYKKDLKGNISLIEKELKRCADELASTDESMQTLRDMIREL